MVALIGPLYITVRHYQNMPPIVLWVLLVSALSSVALWVVWRRAQRVALAVPVAFSVAATACSIAADGMLGFGMMWVAMLVLAASKGARAAMAYVLALLVIVAILHALVGSSPERIAQEIVTFLLLSGFGCIFALLLQRSQQAERALHVANDELLERSALEQDLVLTRERERTARGLHDGLGHRLTAIGLSLEFAAEVRERDASAAWSEVAEARGTARDALQDMRRLVRAMHPVEFDELRGTESFGAVAEAFRSTGLDIKVSVSGEDTGNRREQLLVLLRLVQEGLTNVVRHSDASTVRIEIVTCANGISATIEDDGGNCGDPVAPEGFGLRSLRERCESLGGRLHISRGDHGFRLRANLPFTNVAVAS